MDHDGSIRRPINSIMVFSTTVFQVKSNGKLEVELNCGALERASKRVFNLNIDLGSIESTISFIQGPFARMEFL